MKRNTKILSIPSAILLFVLGFIITFATSSVLSLMHTVIIVIFMIIGIIQLFSFFGNKEYEERFYNNLVVGALSIWFALFTSKNYDIFMELLPTILSLYSLIAGINILEKYYETHNKGELVIAISSLSLAALLVFKPLLMATLYIKLSGLYLIAMSLYFVVSSVPLGYRKKKKRKSKK